MKTHSIFFRVLTVIVLSLGLQTLSAQTGPGGVGNSDGTDGQPENVIWFDASVLGLTNGDQLASWADISGNGNDATQGAGSAQPTFYDENQTGYTFPVVYFDGADDYMPFNGNLIANSDYTVIFVGQRRSNNSFRVFMGGTTSSSNQNLHLYWNGESQFRAHQYGNDLQTDMVDVSQSYSSGTEDLEFGIFTTLLASSDVSDQRRNYQNNHYLGSRSNNTQLSSWNGAAIARYSAGFHDVDAAEIIIYSNAINDAQLQIVHQYLEVKYGITIGNDLYDPNSAYTYNVVGIGKASATDDHLQSGSGGMCVTGLSGVDNGDYLFFSHNNADNASTDFTTDDITGSVQLRYNRIWELQKTNTPSARVAFDFSEAVSDGLYPVNINNYVLLFRNDPSSGNFSVVKNAEGISDGDKVYFDLSEAELQDGYYTFGTEDNTDSPLQGEAGRTWYTLITGNWDNWEVWTLDPSGALPNNPDMLTPSTSPTSTADKVVVLNGKTVTVDTDNKNNASLTVDGRLELGTTTGHSFGKIRGNGRIIMEADNFPATSDASHFVSEGLGEGTVVFEGGSYELATEQEFYDVEIKLTAGNTITLTNNYTINGNVTIESGTLQINDDTDDRIIEMSIDKNLWVKTGAGITTGTGNPFASSNPNGTGPYEIGTGNMPVDDGLEYHSIFHQLTIGGDFQNDGVVRFTNLSAPDFNTLATDGAVTVTFTGASNNNVTLNGTSDFYNFIVNKGVNKNYVLTVYSSAVPNFTLYGANSVGRSTMGSYTDENPLVRKALFIKTGTLKLTGNIDIPSLSEGSDEGGNGDYAVGQNARLWIAGSNVTVYTTASSQSEVTGFESATSDVDTGGSNQALSVYGEFRISDGFFGTRNSAGFIFWSTANAQVKFEGGSVDAAQFRSAGGGAGVASYIQSGGTVMVRGNETATGQVGGYGEVSGSYPIFGFDDPSGVFNMSGGELILRDVGGSNTNGFYVPSAEGNYNVSGGTLTIQLRSGNDFEIGSTAPVWNLEIERLNGSGTALVTLTHDLTVLGDITINDNAKLDVQDDLDASNYDLYIRDDFFLRSDGEYDARDNTTHFIGNTTSIIRVYDNTPGEITFYNLNIEKPLTWGGDYRNVQVNGTNTAGVHPVEITNNLTITRGRFYVEDEEVDLKGNLEIVDGEITHGTGKIVLNGTSAQTIKGSYVKEQAFGSFELYNENGVELLSSINVTDFELTPKSDGTDDLSIVYLNTYNLDVSGSVSVTTGVDFSENIMFATAGNGGDGGMTMAVDFSTGTTDTEHLFPVGTVVDPSASPLTFQYSPVVITQASTIADAGTYTIKPVNNYHPSYNGSDDSKTIKFYWAINATEYSSLTTNDVKYTCTAPLQADGAANKGAWLDYETFLWYEENNIVNAGGGVTEISYPYEASISGDFTVGNKSILNDPEVFFTRTQSNDQPDWTADGTWTELSLLVDTNSDGIIDQEDWHHSSQPAASDDNPTGDYPEQGDIAVIGWVPWHDDSFESIKGYPHSARWNSGDLECAQIMFTQMLDASGNPTERVYRNNFQFRPTFTINSNGTMTIAKISGEGIIRVRDASNIDPDFSSVDLGDFVSQDSAYFLYEGFASQKTYNNAPAIYPNLFISNDGWGAQDDDITINKDITVFGNMEVRGNANYVLPTGAEGDIEIYGDLIIDQDPVSTGGAEFAFGNTGTAREVYLHGDLLLNGDGAKIWVRNPENTDIVDHNFILEGNITQTTTGTNDIIRFWTADDEDRVTLNILGDQSADYTRSSGDVSEFYRVIMNKKATSDWVAFNFMDDINFNGPTDGDDKSIELISGRFGLRDQDIDVTLTSGGADFKIPADAKLWLGSSATARISGNNTGIWLDGQLDIGYGVSALFNEGTNNYIEYTASGVSEIFINSGNNRFYVGSQIRRSTTTEEGILNFRLSAETADVKIGTDAGNIPENDRGVFEILNAGSNFEMGEETTLIIVNAQNNAEFPTLYLDPETQTLGTNSTIQFGDNNTASSQIIGLYSNISLKNLDIVNSPTLTDPSVKLWYDELTVEEDITIGSGTELDADGWNITLYGNWTNSGNFSANSNTVLFVGKNDQTLTGATTFYNLTKTTGNTLRITSPLTVENALDIQDGTFSDFGNTITVFGNVNNDGTHDWGDAGYGLFLNGSRQQVVVGDGIFGKITLNNTFGAVIPTTSSEIIIDDAVELQNGIFDIGRNLMSLDTDAEFIEGSAYSENNMIQTNLSFTDNGIRKYYPAIIPADNYEFTYPIGSMGKYTPVVMNISNMDASGSIKVKAADEMQSTISDDSDECNEFDDTQNVLQYHWTLSADNVYNFSADIQMTFYSEDATVNNTHGYDLSDYITARLLEGTNTWNKYDELSFDENNQSMYFTFANTDDDGITGDYTAGIEQEPGCNGAIPNEVPMYISVQNGNWTEASTWETYPDGDAGPAGGPRGAIVIIDNTHTVTSVGNYILNYKTEIRAGGTLAVNTTYGHRLGLVSGGGTLYMERGDLPAAVYDDFIFTDEGTFEFGGSDDYDILSELPAVHNLTLSGTGQRRFPNLELVIRGNLLIDGDNNTLIARNEHNERIEVWENIEFNLGSFYAGTGTDAVVTAGGNSEQTISGSGSFTGTNAFYHFAMDNPSGLSLSRPVDIDQTLTFTNGVINTDATNILTLKNISETIVTGAGDSKFVNGPLSKNIGLNGDFDFPVGKDGRYGMAGIINVQDAGYWEAEYFNQNPGLASTPEAMDPEALDSHLEFVSNNEYWRVEAPASTKANIKLRWDNLNGGFASDDNRSDMRIAEWDNTTADVWNRLDNTPTISGDASAGTITEDVGTTFNHFTSQGNYFTIASIYTPDIFEWEGDISSDWNVGGNWVGGNVPTALDDITIATIDTYEPVISSMAAYTGDLDLQAGRTLTISADASLTVTGDMILNGTLVIESSSANGYGSGQSGSFINEGGLSGSGQLWANRYLSGGIFHYLSSPVDGTAAGNANSDLFTNHSSGNFNPNFFKYDETLDIDGDNGTAPEGAFDPMLLQNAWIYAHNGDGGAAIPMINGQGYAHYDTGSKTIRFEGRPNSGNFNLSSFMTYSDNDPTSGGTPSNAEFYDGWNLVANPYPSYVDWDAVNRTNVDNAYYIWNGTQYISYVNGSSTDNLTNEIAPMQAFFVHANGSAPAINLSNDDRIHGTSDFYKNGNPTDSPARIVFKASGNGFDDRTVFYTERHASAGYDGAYDAFRLLSSNPNVPHLYTLIDDGMISLSINAFGNDLQGNTEIPIGFYAANAGTFTLSLDEFAQLDEYNLYFEDKVQNIYLPVADMPEVTFNHTGGKLEDRFVLHLNANNAPLVNAAIEDRTIVEDENYEFTIDDSVFEEQDLGDYISEYQATLANGDNLPEWILFNAETLTFSGTPANENVGSVLIRLEAFDTHQASAQINFMLTVLNTNDAPILTGEIENQKTEAGQYYEYIFDEGLFIDIDPDDALSYSAYGYLNGSGGQTAGWLTIDPETRRLYGTPNIAEAGVYTVYIRATDNFGAFIEADYELEVLAPTGVTENPKDISLTLYPNPTSDGFHLQTETAVHAEITILDIKGQTVMHTSVNSDDSYISIKHLASGAYMVKIRTEENTYFRKLFID